MPNNYPNSLAMTVRISTYLYKSAIKIEKQGWAAGGHFGGRALLKDAERRFEESYNLLAMRGVSKKDWLALMRKEAAAS